MQDLPCVHTNNYACGFNCRSLWLRERHRANPKVLNEIFPSWAYSGSRSIFDESGDEESRLGQITKRRRCGKLTFVEGSFRPLILLDDDTDGYEVIPRPLLRAGKIKSNPIILDDEILSPSAAATASSHVVGSRDVTESLSETMTNASVLHSENYGQHASEPTPYSNLQFSMGCEDDWTKNPTQWGLTHQDGLVKNRSISLPAVVRPCMDGTPLNSWSYAKIFSPLFDKAKLQASDSDFSRVGSERVPRDTIPIEDRKRLFIYTPTSAMMTAMRRYVSLTYALLDEFREPEDCWLHPYPPSPKRNGRARGVIHNEYKWTDPLGSHTLAVNFGVTALIVESSLTEEQKEGYINDKWHLSHLCGNWTCCNWRHLTVEAGSINISRNACFMLPETCRDHAPPCMKTRKRRLSATNMTSRETCCNSDSEGRRRRKECGGSSQPIFGLSSCCEPRSTDSMDTSKEVHEVLRMPEDPKAEGSDVDGKQSDRSSGEDAAPSIYI